MEEVLDRLRLCEQYVDRDALEEVIENAEAKRAYANYGREERVRLRKLLEEGKMVVMQPHRGFVLYYIDNEQKIRALGTDSACDKYSPSASLPRTVYCHWGGQWVPSYAFNRDASRVLVYDTQARRYGMYDGFISSFRSIHHRIYWLSENDVVSFENCDISYGDGRVISPFTDPAT